MTAPHPLHTPALLSLPQLEAATVGPRGLVDRLTRRLLGATTSTARPHTLLIGARGVGKTHLLALATKRAQANARFSRRALVVTVGEDGVGIGSYGDLLVEIVRSIEPSREAEAGELRRQKRTAAIEEVIREIRAGRVLVLVVENLDRVFGALGSVDAGALRGFVETDQEIVVLASAPAVFDGVARREEPWFGSFDMHVVDGLDAESGAQIVRTRALAGGQVDLAAFVTTSTGRARLAALHHLVGGSARLWHLLADVVTVEALDDLGPAVDRVIDALVPHYQQRLWALAPNEQRIITAVARAQGASSVGAIAEAAGLEERVVSTTIGRLEKSSWVRKVEAPGVDARRSYYELRDPVLRYHLAYRALDIRAYDFAVDVVRRWFAPQEVPVNGEPGPDSDVNRSLTPEQVSALITAGLPEDVEATLVMRQVSACNGTRADWLAGLRTALASMPSGQQVSCVTRAVLGDPEVRLGLPVELRRLVDAAIA